MNRNAVPMQQCGTRQRRRHSLSLSLSVSYGNGSNTDTSTCTAHAPVGTARSMCSSVMNNSNNSNNGSGGGGGGSVRASTMTATPRQQQRQVQQRCVRDSNQGSRAGRSGSSDDSLSRSLCSSFSDNSSNMGNATLTVSRTHTYANSRGASSATGDSDSHVGAAAHEVTTTPTTTTTTGTHAHHAAATDSDAVAAAAEAQQLQAIFSNIHFGLAAYVYGDVLGFGVQPSSYDGNVVTPRVAAQAAATVAAHHTATRDGVDAAVAADGVCAMATAARPIAAGPPPLASALLCRPSQPSPPQVTPRAHTRATMAGASGRTQGVPPPPPSLQLSMDESRAYMDESWFACALDTPVTLISTSNNSNGNNHNKDPSTHRRGGGGGGSTCHQGMQTSLTVVRSDDYANDEQLREYGVMTCSSASLTIFPHIAPPQPHLQRPSGIATAAAALAPAPAAATTSTTAAGTPIAAAAAVVDADAATHALSLSAVPPATMKADAAASPRAQQQQQQQQRQPSPMLRRQLTAYKMGGYALPSLSRLPMSLPIERSSSALVTSASEQQQQQQQQQQQLHHQPQRASVGVSRADTQAMAKYTATWPYEQVSPTTAAQRASHGRRQRAQAYIERRRKERADEAVAATARAWPGGSAVRAAPPCGGVAVDVHAATGAAKNGDANSAARHTTSLPLATPLASDAVAAVAAVPLPLPPLLLPQQLQQQPPSPRDDGDTHAESLHASACASLASASAPPREAPAPHTARHGRIVAPATTATTTSVSAVLMMPTPPPSPDPTSGSSSVSDGAVRGRDDPMRRPRRSTHTGRRRTGDVSLPGAAPIGANGPAWPGATRVGQMLHMHTPPQPPPRLPTAATAPPMQPQHHHQQSQPQPPQQQPQPQPQQHSGNDSSRGKARGRDDQSRATKKRKKRKSSNNSNSNSNSNSSRRHNDKSATVVKVAPRECWAKSNTHVTATTMASFAVQATSSTDGSTMTASADARDTSATTRQLASGLLTAPLRASTSTLATRVRTLVALDRRCTETSNVTHDRELVIVTGDDDFDEYNVDEVMDVCVAAETAAVAATSCTTTTTTTTTTTRAAATAATTAAEAQPPLPRQPHADGDGHSGLCDGAPSSSTLLAEMCRTLLRGCNAALLVAHSAHAESLARKLLCQLVRSLFVGLSSCDDDDDDNHNDDRRDCHRCMRCHCSSKSSSGRGGSDQGNSDRPCRNDTVEPRSSHQHYHDKGCGYSYGLRASFVWLSGGSVTDLLTHTPITQKLVIAVSPIFGSCIDGVQYVTVADADAFEEMLRRATQRAAQLRATSNSAVAASADDGIVYCSLVLKQRCVGVSTAAPHASGRGASRSVGKGGCAGDAGDMGGTLLRSGAATFAASGVVQRPPQLRCGENEGGASVESHAASAQDLPCAVADHPCHDKSNVADSKGRGGSVCDNVDVYVCSLTATLVVRDTAAALYGRVLDHSPHIPRALFHYALGGPCYTVALVCISAEETCAQAMLDVQQRMGEVCNRPAYPGSVQHFVAGVRGDLAPTLRAETYQQQQPPPPSQVPLPPSVTANDAHTTTLLTAHEALQQQLLTMAHDAEALLRDFDHTDPKAYLHRSALQPTQQQHASQHAGTTPPEHSGVQESAGRVPATSAACVHGNRCLVGGVSVACGAVGAANVGTQDATSQTHENDTATAPVACALGGRRVQALVCVEQHDTRAMCAHAGGKHASHLSDSHSCVSSGGAGDSAVLLVSGNTLTVVRRPTATPPPPTHTGDADAMVVLRIDVDEVVTRAAMHDHRSQSFDMARAGDDADLAANATTGEDNSQPLHSTTLDALVAHFVAGGNAGLMSTDSSSCAITPLALRRIVAATLQTTVADADAHAHTAASVVARRNRCHAQGAHAPTGGAPEGECGSGHDVQADGRAIHAAAADVDVTRLVRATDVHAMSPTAASAAESVTSSMDVGDASGTVSELYVSIALVRNNKVTDLLIAPAHQLASEALQHRQATGDSSTTSERTVEPTPFVLDKSPARGVLVRGTTAQAIDTADDFDKLLSIAIERADPQLQLADPGVLVVAFTLRRHIHWPQHDVYVSSLVCTTAFDVPQHFTRALARDPDEPLALFDYLLRSSTYTVALLGICDRDDAAVELLPILQRIAQKQLPPAEAPQSLRKRMQHIVQEVDTLQQATHHAIDATPANTLAREQLYKATCDLHDLQNVLAMSKATRRTKAKTPCETAQPM